VNFQQRLQRFRKAFTPRGDALWAPELLSRIVPGPGPEGAAGRFAGWASLGALWADLAAGEAAFRGVDVAALGGVGTPLGSGREEPAGEGGAGSGAAGAPRAEA
jgi:hypothetical protein